jgi:RNA polymerase I-specific transcription initiation factor RRN11
MDSLDGHRQWNHLDKRYGPFLFASPDGKTPSTARKVHVRRLRDILHLSLQRGDLLLARRAFGLLSRCEEIEWMVIWKIGLVILAVNSPPGDILGTAKHIEFLRAMMLQHPEEVRASHLLV